MASGWARREIPNLKAKGRDFYAELHVAIGVWASVMLLLFLLTGLAWTGVWGSQLVQSWSSFPAEKWDNVPLSDDTHAVLNDSGIAEVPWGLEQTPLPRSREDAGTPVGLDRMTAYARELGFSEQYRINLPKDGTGVYTLSADSMDGDTDDPMGDRTLHIDQYTGEVLATAEFLTYGPLAKVMAVGTAFHMGYMGLWNFALNAFFCLSMIVLAVTGFCMWWKRRPSGALRLIAPKQPDNMPMWKGAVAIMLVMALAFPLAGVTLALVMLFDWLLISRVDPLRRALG